jgi:hypothetical protein
VRTVDSSQQPAGSRQQTANSKQQTANSKQQTANSVCASEGDEESDGKGQERKKAIDITV